MDARRAVERFLEMTCDRDGVDDFDEHLDDTALELLTVLCSNLTMALAAASGRTARAYEAREFAAECAEGIAMVLDVWRSTDVDIVDGPFSCPLLATVPPPN